MNLSLEEISKAVGGALDGPGSVKVRGYSIDTRTLNAGELFFAIKGPRFDGRQFLQQAADKKAAGAVILESEIRIPKSLPLIRVRSTVDALQSLARDVRRRWGMTIIGVTGSVGKTTTKEMIAAVLGKKFTVLRSVGNLNNEFGLPLCLLRAERYQNIGVLEMGMSAKGEILKLTSIAEPNEGVITNVNPVHLAFFKSVDEIAEAKAELLEGLRDPKTAYLNNDDSRVRSMARKFTGKIVTYGVKSVASFKVQQVQDLGLDGSAFTIHHGRRDLNFVLPLLGPHNVSNAMAAIAVGTTHEVPWEQIHEALAEMKPEKMRGEAIKFREGFAVIDDSYNSNPRALSEMIRFLGKLQGYQRKILVAGEMLELGAEGAEHHRARGREAARAGVELIVGVQGQATEILEGALQAGVERSRLKFVRDAVQAGDFLARTLRKGDVVLIKGSRGVKLDQALNTLRAAFSSMEP
ncbi:MAG: UDP-N-acetylmuramoyl-tripeptide--D-alanyl-D-alanine ligase [Acidobacteria bacterium]|nr:UDP-N-acetylmuramoyl-tripeptide--D-alanyl-D-alanine ligase [Acidobacteriota bacterium]